MVPPWNLILLFFPCLGLVFWIIPGCRRSPEAVYFLDLMINYSVIVLWSLRPPCPVSSSQTFWGYLFKKFFLKKSPLNFLRLRLLFTFLPPPFSNRPLFCVVMVWPSYTAPFKKAEYTFWQLRLYISWGLVYIWVVCHGITQCKTE